MYWLALAITLELTGTISMKFSAGFTKLGPSVAIYVLYALSIACLNFALKTIEVGTAYAIWAGIGTAAIAFVGMLWFKETVSFIRISSVLLVIMGVVGLNLSK